MPVQMPNNPPQNNQPQIPMIVQTALTNRLNQADAKRVAAEAFQTQKLNNAITEFNSTLESGKQAAGLLTAAANSPLQQLLGNNALSANLTTDFGNSVTNPAPGAGSFNANIDALKAKYSTGFSLIGSAGPYLQGSGTWTLSGNNPSSPTYNYTALGMPTMTGTALDFPFVTFTRDPNGIESLSTSRMTLDFTTSTLQSSSSYYNGALDDPGWRTSLNVARISPTSNVGQVWQLNVFDSTANGPTEASANATLFDGEKFIGFSYVKGADEKLDVLAGFDNETTQVTGGVHIDNPGSGTAQRSDWLRMMNGFDVGNTKVQIGVNLWHKPNASFVSSDIEMANQDFVFRAGAASNGSQTGFFANVIDEVFPGHFITGGVSRSFSGVSNSDFIDRTSPEPDDSVFENLKMPDDVLGAQFAPEIPLQLNVGYNFLYRPTKRYSYSFDAVTSFGLSNADRNKFFKGIGVSGSLQY